MNRTLTRMLFTLVPAALVAAAALALSAGAAPPPKLVVDNGRPCSDSTGKPYCHIQAAVNAATVPGTTIEVRKGTYGEQVIVDKPLLLRGEDNKTIIDGSSTPTLPSPGQVRIVADGDVALSGFTVQNAGATAGGVTMAVFAAGPAPGGMTYTLTHDTIVGSGDPSGGDFGFYAQNAYDTLVFTHNDIGDTASNAIVLERHYGSTDVSENRWDRGVSDGSVDPYFAMNYGNVTITALQRVSHNRIDMGTGTSFTNDQRGFAISFAGGAYNTTSGPNGQTTGAAGFTNVQIDRNEIVNVKPFRKGIGFWNDASGPSQAGGNVTGVIENNHVQGAPGDDSGTIGIRMLGLISTPVIQRNDLKRLETGVQLRRWNGANTTAAQVSDNHMDVSLGAELYDGAAMNILMKNHIDADGTYTITLAAGTSDNTVQGNHLKAATLKRDASVQDDGTGNTVSDNH